MWHVRKKFGGVSEKVANCTSGGRSHLTDFKKSQNLGFFELRSEASGMVLVDRKVVCIGPDWCLGVSGTVYCWSGTIYCTWGCSKDLLKKKVGKSILKPMHNLGFSQIRLGTPLMVLLDIKVVCIGPCWCLEVSGTVCCWSGTTSLWHICRRPANRPFCLDPI